MKLLAAVTLTLSFLGCQQEANEDEMLARESETLATMVSNLHAALAEAYAGAPVDIDSLFAAYYDPEAYYVTPWGSSEPVDSTKSRLEAALPRISDFEYRIENLNAESFGKGGFAWFILRQSYSVDGFALDEYLPTTFVFKRRADRFFIVHVQRSTDMATLQQYIDMNARKAAGSR